jgi:type I restriction enzyme S subunit
MKSQDNKAWPNVRIGDILTYLDERVSLNDSGEYITITVKRRHRGLEERERLLGHQILSKKQFRVVPGAFIISRIQCWHEAYAIVPQNIPPNTIASANYDQFAISPSVDPSFLWWLSHSPLFRETIRSSAFGVVIEKMVFDREAWLNKTLPIPPIVEQQRLVARIEELYAKVREASALRRQSSEEVGALFERTRANSFVKASEKGVRPLSEVATLERGKFSHRPRNEPRFFGGEHPWIQIGEIERAHKYIREWHETLNDSGLAISKKFPKGTVLVSIAATIGATGILDFDCCVPDSIVGVTPKPGTDSEFLYHYLGYVRTHLETVAPQSAQKNINLQILSPLPVPKLSLSEQQRIVADLDAMQAQVDSVRALQDQTAAELDALMPSILSKAFNGEL